jgi:hypothetical protein
VGQVVFDVKGLIVAFASDGADFSVA